ncbi:hypothetical protein LX36DRAFT_358072 [Colletotrichum falcatum]|nr:hypothetical protein LX36DRAFT_358072 [Colletotrichum falcatum]
MMPPFHAFFLDGLTEDVQLCHLATFSARLPPCVLLSFPSCLLACLLGDPPPPPLAYAQLNQSLSTISSAPLYSWPLQLPIPAIPSDSAHRALFLQSIVIDFFCVSWLEVCFTTYRTPYQIPGNHPAAREAHTASTGTIGWHPTPVHLLEQSHQRGPSGAAPYCSSKSTKDCLVQGQQARSRVQCPHSRLQRYVASITTKLPGKPPQHSRYFRLEQPSAPQFPSCRIRGTPSAALSDRRRPPTGSRFSPMRRRRRRHRRVRKP